MTGCQKSSDSASSLPPKGSIYGIITDFQTGEPVRNANVQLRPSGETTLTGSNGIYEFADINDGDYSITVSKAEYTDLIDDYVISVRDGRRMKRDVQIQKQSAVLSIVDNNQAPLHELDFGSAGVSQKTFNIFNSGTVNLRFEITKTANWITDINPSNETVNMGSTRAISVTINRSLLSIGENITTIVISTNSGGVELLVKAINDGNNINDLVVELHDAGLMVQKMDLGCWNLYAADEICQNSHIANYNDWRLPTIDELEILFNHKEYIGDFDGDYYWSSTKRDSPYSSEDTYYTYRFLYSASWTTFDLVSRLHYVRAVRSMQ
jgi:Protein of unknown function (DUF1566).